MLAKIDDQALHHQIQLKWICITLESTMSFSQQKSDSKQTFILQPFDLGPACNFHGTLCVVETVVLTVLSGASVVVSLGSSWPYSTMETFPSSSISWDDKRGKSNGNKTLTFHEILRTVHRDSKIRLKNG